jgi:hypothetical protein
MRSKSEELKPFQEKTGAGQPERQDDRYDTGIIEGAWFSGFLHRELLVLGDIFDDKKPQQDVVDLDSPFRKLVDDHHGKDNAEGDKHESQYQEEVGHWISPWSIYYQKMGTAYQFPDLLV